MNTYLDPIEILVFGDFMACEILDAQPRSDGVSYLCRPDDHTASIAAKFGCEIERQRPEQAVVFAGAQDAIMGMQSDEFEFNISILVQTAKECHVPLTLITPLFSGDPVIEKRLATYRERLYVFDRQHKLYLFDLYRTLWERVEDSEGEKMTKRQYLHRYYADNIHLNKDGKEELCQSIYEYFWGV